ncbi:MAG TPA: amino acid ABC transporter ATP-binding protein [Verrucomicrobiae bacterium]|jgi:polar amino acid transport system ATP-binding protein
MIIVEKLFKSYRGTPVLHGIDLRQQRGEVLVLIGASGCGKSTLLRCLNQLELADSGQITIGDTTISGGKPPRSRADWENQHQLRLRTGMVFQTFNLFHHLSLLQNVMRAPCVVKGLPPKEAEDLARKLLGKVGLSDKASLYPSQLSGGQQQRGAIARALAMEPEVMLFDEPTSALDPGLKEEVMAVIRQLSADGMTMMVVTHEMKLARDIANKVLFLAEGRIVETGTPDQIFYNPQSERTRDFLRRGNSG